MKPKTKVTGRKIDLSDGRSVFLGNMAGDWAVRFINAGGEETNLTVSPEAMDALVRLHTSATTPAFDGLFASMDRMFAQMDRLMARQWRALR